MVFHLKRHATISIRCVKHFNGVTAMMSSIEVVLIYSILSTEFFFLLLLLLLLILLLLLLFFFTVYY